MIANNWSTWDVEHLNAIMKVPELVEVLVGIYNIKTKTYKDKLLWNSVHRLGERSTDGSYFDIDLKHNDFIFRIEFVSKEDVFTLKLTPLNISPNMRFFITGLLRWNVEGSYSKDGNQLILKTSDKNFNISVIGDIDNDEMLNIKQSGILMKADQPVYVRCNSQMNAEQIDKNIINAKECWLDERIHSDGFIKGAPEGAVGGLLWNTIYDPIKKRFCTPVTREWCDINTRPWFGSYVLFEWDTFLGSVIGSMQSKDQAYMQIRSILQEFHKDRIPILSSQANNYVERSQPPVGAYCLLRLYRQFGDIDILEEAFDILYKWNCWWFEGRDGNNDGLMEWGTDLVASEEDKTTQMKGFLNEAKCESGLDNSPMYDDIAFNFISHTMELADVGLNSCIAFDCRALAIIAELLGKDAEARSINEKYKKLFVLINEKMWDEKAGIYKNLHWNGALSDTLAPTSFYPLLAGIVPPERAKRMVEEHLLNELEFWGEYVIPSVAKNHPAFKDNNYWRGRIWGPTNFLVYEGLVTNGCYEVAHEFATKSLKLFLNEWNGESHIHENYNALTGDGDDVENADPVYTWGGLLASIGTSEIAGVDAWNGIRFGNLSNDVGSLKNFMTQYGVFDISTGEKFEIKRNGNILFISNSPVIVKNFELQDGVLRFGLEATNECQITIFKQGDIQECIIMHVDKIFHVKLSSETCYNLNI